jgi:hypothetical protein
MYYILDIVAIALKSFTLGGFAPEGLTGTILIAKYLYPEKRALLLL